MGRVKKGQKIILRKNRYSELNILEWMKEQKVQMFLPGDEVSLMSPYEERITLEILGVRNSNKESVALIKNSERNAIFNAHLRDLTLEQKCSSDQERMLYSQFGCILYFGDLVEIGNSIDHSGKRGRIKGIQNLEYTLSWEIIDQEIEKQIENIYLKLKNMLEDNESTKERQRYMQNKINNLDIYEKEKFQGRKIAYWREYFMREYKISRIANYAKRELEKLDTEYTIHVPTEELKLIKRNPLNNCYIR